jgi:hypothetical protein
MDFQFDATADWRRIKFLNVIDEYSRLCLTIRVGRRCKARDVVAMLEELTRLYPAPRLSSAATTVRSSLPMRSDAGARAPARERPTSSQDHRGRTALPSRSTAASGTNCSIQSCTTRGTRPRTWLTT